MLLKRTLFIALFSMVAACSSDSSNNTNTDGTDGTSATDGTDGTTSADGTDGTDGTDGADGTTGADGTDGTTGADGTGMLGKDNPPALGAQIDRMGRAAISSALVGTFNPDDTGKGMTKDAYNASSDPSKWQDEWAGEIQANLAILDALDANCGNQLLADKLDTRYAFLASVLADDRLYLNSGSGNCVAYLGVEAQVVGAVADGGCGGRTLTYDVIETSYSALAAGLLAGVDDGISEDDVAPLADFPYVAAPSE